MLHNMDPFSTLDLLSIAILIALSTLAFYWYRNENKRKTLPPGPSGLPIIGNKPIFFNKRPHEYATSLKEKYGDIVSVSSYISPQPLILLSNMDLVRQVFNSESATSRRVFSAVRTEFSTAESNSPDASGHGLLFSQGELWKVHRRFALSTLRDLGMGKNWLEDSILAEVENLQQALLDTNQQPFNPKVLLTNSISNVICALIFGQRFSLTDGAFSRLTNYVAMHVQSASVESSIRSFPWLKKFPNPIRSKLRMLQKNLAESTAFFRERIKDHSQNVTRQEEAPDYLYAYQKEMTKELEGNGVSKVFTEKQLLASLFDLFLAGTETTSSTTLWAFVFLLENPMVMRKMQEEMDENVGRQKLVTSADRGRLTYTDAVILEVQRLATITPFAIPHRLHDDLLIEGFVIPKGSVCMANLFSIHRDPRWWTDPTKFDPMRFLDENKKIVRPAAFAPFSVGKRSCLGESLAKMELFLFIANLVNRFTLSLPAGSSISSDDYITGATLAPIPFELIFTPRS